MKRIAYFLVIVIFFILQACSSGTTVKQKLIPPVQTEEPYNSSLAGAAANTVPGSAIVPALCQGAEDTNTAAFAAEVIRLVNEERAKVGLGALTSQSQLTQAAQKHSIDLACNGAMGHTGSDGSSPFDRITQFGYAYIKAGENMAAGYRTPADVMVNWMSSDGHRNNILKPEYIDIGIGYVYNSGDPKFKHNWVMTLGKPK